MQLNYLCMSNAVGARGWMAYFGIMLVTWGCVAKADAADNWLQFRGDGGRSAASTNPPTSFGGDQNENIVWNFTTAGRGVGSPIVVGDLVVTTSSGGQDERDLYVEAVDRQTGKLVWRREAHALGRPFTHPTSANASPTPASDGERIYSLFSSCDLLCHDLDGQLLWYRALAVDHPKTGNDVSMSSSPAVIDGVVAVQLENQGDSFAMGIDAKTGETLWRMDRPRRANWASPLPVEMPDGRPGFVLQNDESLQIVGHRTGEKLVQFDLGGSTVASPVLADDRLLVPANGLTVIQLSGPSPVIEFESTRTRTRNASHVVYRGRVYGCNGSVLIAADLIDGRMLWQERMPDIRSVWATPVATASGIYVFDQDGAVTLLRDDYDSDEPKCEIVGTFKIPGPVLGSPAVVGDAIYVRAENSLYKIGSPN